MRRTIKFAPAEVHGLYQTNFRYLRVQVRSAHRSPTSIAENPSKFRAIPPQQCFIIDQITIDVSVTKFIVSGEATARADHVRGTSVRFGRSAAKFDIPQITPEGPAARFGTAQIWPAGNGFSVFLYDSSGARTDGKFSWKTTGIT